MQNTTAEQGQTEPQAAQQTSELYCEAAARQLDGQWERLGRLDAKAGTVFGFSSAVIAFFAVFAPLGAQMTTVQRMVVFGLVAASLVVYVVLMGYLLLAYQINHGYSGRPNLVDLENVCKTQPVGKVYAWLGREYAVSAGKNATQLALKARRIQVALTLAPVEVALLVLAALLRLVV